MKKNTKAGTNKKGTVLSKKIERPTADAILRTISDVGGTLSKRAKIMSDICINDNNELTDKAGKVTSEIVLMFKEGVSSTSKNFKKLTLDDIINDTSYGIGQLSKKSGDALDDILSGFQNEEETVSKELYIELGNNIYDWRKNSKLTLLFGTDGRALETEVERISALIEYVKNKMSTPESKVD